MAGRSGPRGCWTWTAKAWQYGDIRCGHAQAYFDAVMAAKLTSMRSCAIWRTTKGAAVDNWPPSQVGIPKSWLIPRSSPCCPLMRMRLSRPSHRASRGITVHDFGVHFPGGHTKTGKGRGRIFVGFGRRASGLQALRLGKRRLCPSPESLVAHAW